MKSVRAGMSNSTHPSECVQSATFNPHGGQLGPYSKLVEYRRENPIGYKLPCKCSQHR
jgi:hypothetical protein